MNAEIKRGLRAMWRPLALTQLVFCAHVGIFGQSIRPAPTSNTARWAEMSNQKPVARKADAIDFPGPNDFSRLSWTEAFDALHKLLVTEYPFTDWRRIDWQKLYRLYQHRIVEAQRDNDADGFRLAIREYVYSIPDGHMHVHGPFEDLRKKQIGGGFGFAIALLDDGRVVCYRVEEESPAARAGLKPGARIVSFDGKAIKAAALGLPVLWTRKPVSTLEQRRIEEYRYLSRAPVGTSAHIGFLNPGDTAVRVATLTAIDDSFEYLRNSQPPWPVRNGQALLSHKILDSAFGYIAIFGEDANIMPEFKKTLQEMIEQKVPALILDIRQNPGGDDEPAAQVASFFHTEKSLFEYAQYYNSATGTFDILTTQTIYVDPQQPHFNGPVIALIGPGTASSGEGIALEISRAPRGRTLGLHGTAGYFGMSGGSAKLPNNVEVGFPIGASLDKKEQIQVDSDYSGAGGVLPQITVRRTYENMLAIGRGEDVELKIAERELAQTLAKQE